MARQYAKVYTSIWSSDFAALSAEAQRVYLMTISLPKLSLAGVVAYQPRRWAKFANSTTVEQVEAAVAELVTARYFLVDEDTEEVAIRSFIRHDGGYHNKFIRKGIEAAISAIESPILRDHAALELRSAMADKDTPPPLEDPYEDPSEESCQDPYEGAYEANYNSHPSPTPETIIHHPVVALVVDSSAAEPNEDGRGNRIITEYARIKTAKAKNVRNPTTYAAKCAKEARNDCDLMAEIQRLSSLFPTAPPAVIAAAALGEKHSLTHYPRADEIDTKETA